MTYQPAPAVTVDGVDYTGRVLESVKVVRGRDNLYQQPQAGYCIFEVIDLNGDGLRFDILATVQVSLADSTSGRRTVFTGTVSDWNAQLYDLGETGNLPAAIYTVTAVSGLAALSRRQVAVTGLDASKDGERILALVAGAVGISWEEVPTDVTWANIGQPTTTWDTVDAAFDPNQIDTPGVFDIAALPASDGGYNPLTESYLTAVSGRGILFDTVDGFIGYADADRRETLAAAGFLELSAGIFRARTLSTGSTQSDLTNRVSVTFSSGQAIYSDENSITTYGVRARQFETNLADSGQALAWALDYLEDHAGPSFELRSLGIRLDGLSDLPLVEDLLDLDINSPVELVDLPRTLETPARLETFVEGVGWRIDRDRVELELSLTDARLSIGSLRWGSVEPDLKWEDVDAMLAWEDARSF